MAISARACTTAFGSCHNSENLLFTVKCIVYLIPLQVIYDTDDDNIPLQTSLPLDSPLANLESGQKTVNIYRYWTLDTGHWTLDTAMSRQFTDHRVWPRGFPLEDLRKEEDLSCCKRTEVKLGAKLGV